MPLSSSVHFLLPAVYGIMKIKHENLISLALPLHSLYTYMQGPHYAPDISGSSGFPEEIEGG